MKLMSSLVYLPSVHHWLLQHSALSDAKFCCNAHGVIGDSVSFE